MEKLHLLMVWGSFLLFGQSTALLKTEVCYGKYGCFSHAAPFYNLLMMLPQDPYTIYTQFLLFTRSNKGYAQMLCDEDNGCLEDSNFDISRRTILVCHGWTENGRGHYNWQYRLKDALLNREDCNVILIDWSGGSKSLYGQSSGNTRLVGAQAAELIKFIIRKNGGSKDLSDRFYFIGFSLGAQIAGYTGRRLRESNMPLGRITGLDPANPYYGYTNPEVRLDATDAKLVDVIHTNEPMIGTPQMVGHIDFLPNGGANQPGCLSKPLDAFYTVGCDHLRATEYYIATVENKCSWKAYPCHDYLQFRLGFCTTCNGECPTMGYLADQTNKTGSYYLRTNSQKPFCALS